MPTEAKATFALHLTGMVQGVGFRPLVYRTAKQYKLHGFVRNDNGGVFIEVSGNERDVERFYQELIQHPPAQAKVVAHSIRKIGAKNYHGFEIVESETEDKDTAFFITPDFALCDRCRAELHDAGNRRCHYPFITCTDCGPRYSLLGALPFDRDNTSMRSFQPCKACGDEYQDAGNVRFYSQTNSCPDCGVRLQLFDKDRNEVSGSAETLLSLVAEQLQAGKIVAVKGIGGFLLLCDAAKEQSIKALRTRKLRPVKPFAVMYPSMSQVERDYVVDTIEKEALQSAVAPIVLLQKKEDAAPLAWTEVAPKLNRVGVFLPYAPLLECLLSLLGKPVVATSANRSGDSLVYDNEKALQELPLLADFILLHNRAITMPQDDSVVQFSAKTKTRIILRNGRGLAPVHFGHHAKSQTVFAAGALLKSSFALAHNGRIYVSQYLGNTDAYEAQQTYQTVAERFLDIAGASPGRFVGDKHPGYFSTQWAMQKSAAYKAVVESVQHHKAHFAAVLAEHDLIDTEEKILGIVWDGTGWGDDGQVWGGEFLAYRHKRLERLSHFEYAANILGDKMAKEPRLSALAFCRGLADDLLQAQFTEQEWALYNKLRHQPGNPRTSSCGRLFDAVAALLGLCTRQSYEGEAALLLEDKATDYWRTHPSFDESYGMEWNEGTVAVSALLAQIIVDVRNNTDKGKIALQFHFSLVQMVEAFAAGKGFKYIAFSGGVFQNALLVDLMKLGLENKYSLFFHQRLSPNDENISFGQLAVSVMNGQEPTTSNV